MCLTEIRWKLNWFSVQYETGDLDDDDNDNKNGLTNTLVLPHNEKNLEKLWDNCKQDVTDTQKLEKKYNKLKKRYLNLCVRFAELDVQYNDLLNRKPMP